MIFPTLVLRALNEYRKRDLLTYLGLRYIFSAFCTRTNLWMETFATHAFPNHPVVSYRACQEFKGMAEDGTVEYRSFLVPTVGEVMAETFVLSCLPSAGPAFRQQAGVYSYRLVEGQDNRGLFTPYFEGYRERQHGITVACRQHPTHVVSVFDIRKFYPNISMAQARSAFELAAANSTLSEPALRTANRLLEDYAHVADAAGRGVPVGPAFSHVLGNLLLQEVDQRMLKLCQGQYFRYVDDIIMVSEDEQVSGLHQKLVDLLEEKGLKLHPDKDDRLSAKDWLQSAPTYGEDTITKAWRGLVWRIKVFALLQPGKVTELEDQLLAQDIRLPIQLQVQQANEPGYRARVEPMAKGLGWPLSGSGAAQLKEILQLARKTRLLFRKAFNSFTNQPAPSSGMRRKWHLQRIKFLHTKRLYLEETGRLKAALPVLQQYPELHDLTVVTQAFVSQDLSPALELAGRAGQALGQLFATARITPHLAVKEWTPAEIQALAMLRLHGVSPKISFGTVLPAEDRLFALVEGQREAVKHLIQPHDFYDEMFSLSGSADAQRHGQLLNTLFAPEEEPVFDTTLLGSRSP